MSRFGKFALGTALKRYKKQSFCIKDMPQTVEQFNDSPVFLKFRRVLLIFGVFNSFNLFNLKQIIFFASRIF
jgi:hypothetical protein